MKTHTLDTVLPGGAPAYLANGLVGLRVGPVPLPRGTALVGGFVGLSPEKRTEEYADAPYPVGADILLEDIWLSARPDLARFETQRYDFSCGELTSRFTFLGARVEVVTFCCRTEPTLAVQQIAVEVEKPGRLVLQANLDPRGLMGQLGYRCMPARYEDGVLRWDSRGGLSSVGAAYASDFTGGDLAKRRRNDYGHEEDLQLTEYHIDARPGVRYVMRQYGSLVPSLLHDEPHWQAARHVGYAQWLGFDGLRAANRQAWAELWQSRPRLIGAETRWQDAADAAFFYLHSSVTPASPCSVAPFGLSQRRFYSGHVFWDTEAFILPAMLLASPDTARAMLEYRAQRLPMARANARLGGQRGARFPAQSGNTGCELTPFYAGADANLASIHNNFDVAAAMSQYVRATGDDLFFKQQAWPVIQEIAEWLCSRATRTERGYELRHVTGPDESPAFDNVDNNAYTNMGAVLLLRDAIASARQLGLRPPRRWEEMERNFYLPIDREAGLLLKHDGYRYEGGMCVPDPLCGIYPMGFGLDPAVEQATYRFYVDRADTYLGMPMFSSFFCIWAARRGDRALARRMLAAGVGDNVVGPFHQFIEATARHRYSDATQSVFLTNAAGLLMACYLGLPGLHISAGPVEEWRRYPVSLPEGWEAIEVDRVWVRGEPARLRAEQGAAKAELEML